MVAYYECQGGEAFNSPLVKKGVVMFGRISNTWGLMGDSWRILKQDKELLLFPLLSGICCIIVIASFAIPMFASDSDAQKNLGRAARVQFQFRIHFLVAVFARHSPCRPRHLHRRLNREYSSRGGMYRRRGDLLHRPFADSIRTAGNLPDSAVLLRKAPNRPGRIRHGNPQRCDVSKVIAGDHKNGVEVEA